MLSELKESSKLVLAQEVEEYLKTLGLADRVGEILQRAAIVSHPKGNRRYHNLIFHVQDGEVTSVVDIRKTDNSGRPDVFVVWEPCPCVETNELNCKLCDGARQIKIVRKVKK